MPKLSPPKLIEDLVSEIDSPDALAETGLPHLLSNKVYLYAITSVISLSVIGFTILVSQLSQESLDQISGILDRIGFMDLKLSYSFVQGFKFPSPVSILVIASNSAFILYAVNDSIKDKKGHSKNHFKESYAVSYALHLLFLLVLFVTIFLAYTPKPKVKVNIIEFITTQEPTKQKPPPETPKKSERPSIDQGKNDPNKPIKPVNKSPGKPQEPKKLVKAGDPSKPKSQAEIPKPKPVPMPKGLSGGSANSDSKEPPALAPKARSQNSDNKLAPKDIKTDTASDSLAERAIPKIPNPSLPTGSGSDFKPSMAKSSGSFSGGASDELPSPKNYGYSRGSGGGIGGGRGSGTGSNIGTPKDASQIAGTSRSGGQDLVDRLGNIKAPDNIDVNFGSDGLGNPNKNPYGDRPPSTASIPEIAFGPYMARIQEMIKQRWKPPRGSESKRIVVHFAINRDGSLSNLRLMQTNGDTLANEAALNAVRNAAAFPPLPAGSAPSIDIEFTFDYNVFKRSRY
ncbi:MAG: TonB family protein [Candidatus Melainabacteria bacterium]|nr:TonB family protein [Candidatus Melainabacteria bacterium]